MVNIGDIHSLLNEAIGKEQNNEKKENDAKHTCKLILPLFSLLIFSSFS